MKKVIVKHIIIYKNMCMCAYVRSYVRACVCVKKIKD